MSKANLKKVYLAAYRQAKGNVTLACMSAGISRTTYYKWRDVDAKFKQECEDIEEEAIDFVENKLLGRINDNDTTAIIFFLKTKGKKRGYVEKVEQDVTVNPFEELMKTLPEL